MPAVVSPGMLMPDVPRFEYCEVSIGYRDAGLDGTFLVVAQVQLQIVQFARIR